MTGEASKLLFVVKNREAIDELVTKIVDGAMKGLPCLSVNNPRENLLALIDKVLAARFDGGKDCTGAWEEDGVFEVTVEDGMETGEEMRIAVSLCLGEARIKS